ncbi:MAG: phosphate ABC transporter permease PstA [Desulfatirhabdiaceae bacterium]
MTGSTRKPQGSAATGFNLPARGEPFLWTMAGGLMIGILMIAAFLIMIVWNGLITFYPRQIEVIHLNSGKVMAGEPIRTESFKIDPQTLQKLPASVREAIKTGDVHASRTLYKTGNFDLYNEDYRWITAFDINRSDTPPEMVMVERSEWGPFIGTITQLELGEETIVDPAAIFSRLPDAHREAYNRRDAIQRLERNEIGGINHLMEAARLDLRRVTLKGDMSPAALQAAQQKHDQIISDLQKRYQELEHQADGLKAEDERFRITLADVENRTKTLKLSGIVRIYPANTLSGWQKLGIYFSRWWEFLTAEPREANTEGGVMPAIFGTFTMTLLMVIVVAPFGVMAALYLREYAKQGRLVSLVRICVNNLAGVPSIVYGVFGLGFFAYTVGGIMDSVLFPERLPNPTFGTGGILWAALTLALLTVPVVIVATEEALAAVPHSLREGSLACGASRWQTIKYVVLPKAMPGIMTGLILAMARGAGEVAPLMLVGVVKLAPELPIDGIFPFLHVERSFMHLAFHIFDVGFQSRNSEAGKPMVFVTTLLLISLIAIMNASAIYIRNRLKRRYLSGHF